MLICLFFGFVFSGYAVQITTYQATYVDPGVLKSILELVDSSQRIEVDQWLAKSAKDEYGQGCDSLCGITPDQIRLPGSFYGYTDFVVVNNTIGGAEKQGFSIHLMWDNIISNRVYDKLLWPLNKVRKYGRMNVFGLNVLLVDLSTGSDYFMVDENSAEKYKMRDFPKEKPRALLFEGFDSFWYEIIQGKPVMSEYASYWWDEWVKISSKSE